jgi:hypothetical protein
VSTGAASGRIAHHARMTVRPARSKAAVTSSGTLASTIRPLTSLNGAIT